MDSYWIPFLGLFALAPFHSSLGPAGSAELAHSGFSGPKRGAVGFAGCYVEVLIKIFKKGVWDDIKNTAECVTDSV